MADFYALTTHPEAGEGDVLVLSADGKGIVMRPGSLCPATAQAAAKASTKLATGLSKGEKRNRQRLAEVGAAYHLHPLPRNASDILGGTIHDNNHGSDPPQPPPSRPKAVSKWLTASVVDDAAEVVADAETWVRNRPTEPLERGRRRSRPQAPCRTRQRRLRHLLALPPPTRTTASPPPPLRQPPDPTRRIVTPEERAYMDSPRCRAAERHGVADSGWRGGVNGGVRLDAEGVVDAGERHPEGDEEGEREDLLVCPAGGA